MMCLWCLMIPSDTSIRSIQLLLDKTTGRKSLALIDFETFLHGDPHPRSSFTSLQLNQFRHCDASPRSPSSSLVWNALSATEACSSCSLLLRWCDPVLLEMYTDVEIFSIALVIEASVRRSTLDVIDSSCVYVSAGRRFYYRWRY